MADLGTELSIDPLDDGLLLRGEVDAHTAPALREAVMARLASGSVDVRLDMQAVTFMDSSGLRVVIDATEKARATDGDVILVAPTPTVRRLVEISGLADHLTITDGS